METEPQNAMQGIAEDVERMLSKVKPLSDSELRNHFFKTSISPRMEGCGFRDRYLKDIVPIRCVPQENVYRQCHGLFKRVGAVVALVGERGVGKTFIAARLCRERIEKWMAYYAMQEADRPATPPRTFAHYIKLVDLISVFKPLYADYGTIDTDTLMARRERLCTHSLLCIDELHECHDQRMKGRVLTDIIDRRYSSLRDTLLISNETSSAFKESVGDSVLSRLSEHGRIIECTWPSFRIQ